ncbi:MAG: transposase [Truepera sp.]|nr:transposase [Truepera sp.]
MRGHGSRCLSSWDTGCRRTRRRIRGRRGKRLLRQRGEKLERGFAHLLETGGLRRVHVRGQEEIRKRILIQAAAFNLGLLMRSLYGTGTPRGLQGLAGAQAVLTAHVSSVVGHILRHLRRHLGASQPDPGPSSLKTRPHSLPNPALWTPICSTAC